MVLVKSTSASIGGPEMRHVMIDVTSTRTGGPIGHLQWNNAWSGMPGSMADYVQRDSLDTAAKEIADDLAKLLG